MATPSLAMIPSGYKDGTLYSVLPNNAGGDFNVTRGSLATRVNSNGLIEPVGTLGTDVVLNGDFEETGVEQVTNGDFATDSDWNKNATVTISGGSANFAGVAGRYLDQTCLTNGTSYLLTFDVSAYTSGVLTVFGGAGNSISGVAVQSVGSYSFYFTAGGADDKLYFGSVFTGSIDNVSVKEVGQEWTLSDGCSITAQGARITSDGTFQNIQQANVMVIGDTYEMEYEITESVSGFIIATACFDSELKLKNTVGVHKFYAVAAANFLQIKRASGVTDITIDNIKIKRLNGDDTPRIDYTDGGCPVLLTEPQSTNLITDSSLSNWNVGRATINENANISPSGENDAVALVATAVLEDHQIITLENLPLGEVTYSVFAKQGDKSWIRLWETSTDVYAQFDIVNGVVGSTNGLVTDTSIEDYGNGWFRCSMTYSTLSASSKSIRVYAVVDDSTKNYLGDGVTEDVYLYGGQIEELSYATSLIPTYGTVRTRLQDSVSGAGTSSDFNSTEGTFFFEGSFSSDGRIEINSADNLYKVVIGFSNSVFYRIRENGVNLFTHFISSANQLNSNYKIAVRYESGNSCIYVNGVKESDSDAFSLLGLSELNFVSEGQELVGKTSQIQVFKTALSDFELTQLTTI